jgi:hypothetical protein
MEHFYWSCFYDNDDGGCLVFVSVSNGVLYCKSVLNLLWTAL